MIPVDNLKQLLPGGSMIDLAFQNAAKESYRINKHQLRKTKSNDIITRILDDIKKEKTMLPGEICKKNGHNDSYVYLQYGLWGKCRVCGRVKIG